MVFSDLGYKSTTIVELVRKEGLNVKVSAVCRLLKKYKETGTISRRPGNIIISIIHVIIHVCVTIITIIN